MRRLAAILPRARAARPEEAPRARVRRQLLDDVADLLCAHDLTVNDTNLSVARAYMTGEPDVQQAIEQALRERPRLDDAVFAAIAERRDGALDRELVADAADQLLAKLTECLRIVARSRSLGERYEAAVASETISARNDPAGALARIMRLTRQIVDATRAMEGELGIARTEASGLRSRLADARRDAAIDHLTGLANRRDFERRLDLTAQGAVALVDIDDFKAVNDRHGHDAGDRVLRFVGDLLKRELGEAATVARYGGEEYACLLFGHDAAAAVALLDAARERLAERSLVNQETGQPIGRLTFSAGVATIGATPRAAVSRADEMLYRAKNAGKNRVLVAED